MNTAERRNAFKSALESIRKVAEIDFFTMAGACTVSRLIDAQKRWLRRTNPRVSMVLLLTSDQIAELKEDMGGEGDFGWPPRCVDERVTIGFSSGDLT